MFKRKKKAKSIKPTNFAASLYCHDTNRWSASIVIDEYESFESWAYRNDYLKPWPTTFSSGFPSKEQAEAEACKLLEAVLEWKPIKRPKGIIVRPGDCSVDG